MYQISDYSDKIKNTQTGVIFERNQAVSDFVEYCQWLSEENTPERVAYFEGEENEHQQEMQVEAVKEFMKSKKADGYAYYSDMDLRITMSLSAIERNILFAKLSEIDNLLYPPLNKIKSGDFASALFIFSNQTPPVDEFVLNFYNEAFLFCQDYYNNKYPK